MTVYKWSQTAATNSSADATINWAEGQAPSSVNDSARAMMAAVAKFRDDNAGSLTTGGSSTAYTVSTNQVFASLSVMSGQSISLKFHTTNGASPTLNVDGLGAKAIVTVTGSAVGTGVLATNSIYELVYSNSSSEWILLNGSTITPEFPSGTVMLFVQTAAPTGWTKGSTHDNKALRLVTGSVSTGGSTAFTSVFAARTIAQANLPSVNLTVTDPGHLHNLVNGGTTASGGTSPAVYGAGGSGGQATSIASATTGISVALGGSGTAVDFAVQYVDCIIATKN